MTRSPADGDVLPRVDLTDDRYRVVQSLVRNKYRAEDADGNVVLRGKQKALKMKEEFPFENGDGESAFTVEAGGILDVAGDYTMVDAATDEEVLVLDESYSLVSDVWTLRDPETEAVLGRIESRSTAVELLRTVSSLASVLPHRYDVLDADGNTVGTIEGQFSLRDSYEIRIDDDGDVPKEALVAGAMVVDALEGN